MSQRSPGACITKFSYNTGRGTCWVNFDAFSGKTKTKQRPALDDIPGELFNIVATF